MYYDLIIIGGGAAGISAAINAKDMGINVAIIEKSNRIGKKILTTGNGRCNITNQNIDTEKYHSSNKSFPNYILKKYSPSTIEDFFSSLGLKLTTLKEGKMYPMSLQASSVVDIFLMSLNERDIPIHTDFNITNITKNKNGFLISFQDGENFSCNYLLIATGGKSYAKTGSDGSGYLLARKLGHDIVTPKPALVQLKLNHTKLKSLSGIKFDGYASFINADNIEKREFGEILFTDYGISGPPILQLSRHITKELNTKKKTFITIDMMPNFSEKDLSHFLENQWGIFSYRSIFDSLIGIVNKKMIPTLLKESGILDIHKPCWSLEYAEKNSLLDNLKNWRFEIVDTKGFNNAQVTVGGVNTYEVDSNTLESKITPNLYFAGEILDVDGRSGGYNLHWAWASGIQAGKCIARSLSK